MKLPTEILYDRFCDIYEYQTTREEQTGIDSQREVLTYGNIPCRISYKSIPNTDQIETGAGLKQVIKLFCTPDISILPGSRIVSRGETYQAAGKPAVYISHQEVELLLEREWA